MDDSQTTLTLGFLVIPFLVTLILTGIHVYLGLHVLSRGVIFVDLALAQVAALGATFATLVDHSEIHGGTSYWWALGFTLAGAVVFAGTRRLASRVPQEAIIGIVYAVASAAVILVMDRAPHGAEHIKSLLVRDILWVQDWGVVADLAAIYGAIGAFHWLFRRRFLDATFGAVVTSSVQVAGVLLVFSYLMVPSVMAALLVDSIGARLAVGWTVGFVVSVAGLFGSARFDLPTGATVVVTFGSALVLLGVALGVRRLARGRT
jgi:zinc/manganese transport system permease protein